MINNLLKQTIPEAICIKENGFRDTSRCDELKQVIYSLRDIQYMLRGPDYSAHRSTQTRKMTIFEIRAYLESIFKSKDNLYSNVRYKGVFIANCRYMELLIIKKSKLYLAQHCSIIYHSLAFLYFCLHFTSCLTRKVVGRAM